MLWTSLFWGPSTQPASVLVGSQGMTIRGLENEPKRWSPEGKPQVGRFAGVIPCLMLRTSKFNKRATWLTNYDILWWPGTWHQFHCCCPSFGQINEPSANVLFSLETNLGSALWLRAREGFMATGFRKLWHDFRDDAHLVRLHQRIAQTQPRLK